MALPAGTPLDAGLPPGLPGGALALGFPLAAAFAALLGSVLPKTLAGNGLSFDFLGALSAAFSPLLGLPVDFGLALEVTF
ncbi:MAG: hypothetical protein QM784_15370 [Polyangiaceae bacterium]